MTGLIFDVLRLDGRDRSSFFCGTQALDDYFHRQIGQDERRGVSRAYLAVQAETGMIAGFYTIAASECLLDDLPPPLQRKLPRYPRVPSALVGRLAVDHRFQGCKLGAALLQDASMRATESGIAVFALLVDAKDDRAAAFYRHHGFGPFAASPLRLFAPLPRLLGR
jgi:GNAT superfamily N-acetyltransferase